MSKTAIWDSLKRVPKEHLKPFKRAGGFTGTAIKPMWTFHRMTEEFGPCGVGWGVNAPSFQTVPGHNGEVMVYCTVSIWHSSKDNLVYGVGGDRIVTYVKPNEQYHRPERWDNDDEAFKKAFTDAVTNALKMIGAGADIHMGLWDGNKYVDEKKPKDTAGPHSADYEVDRDPDSDTSTFTGTPGVSKAPSRAGYDALIKEMRICTSVEAMREWYKLRRAEINALPAEWMNHFDEDCQKHKDSLTARAA